MATYQRGDSSRQPSTSVATRLPEFHPVRKSSTTKTHTRHHPRLVCLLVTCCCGWIAIATTSVQGANIVSIEEHWELSVGKPTPERSSPQASMIMSPSLDLSGTFFIFTLNHKSLPDFSAGGMQVQEWEDVNLRDTHNGPQAGALTEEDEMITWTQRMTVQDGLLSFEIVDGSSQTWTSFGGEGYLKLSATTTLDNLNHYRVFNSLSESEVGYAGNRVESLVLRKLRWVTDDGEVHELVSPIAIDTDLDP